MFTPQQSRHALPVLAVLLLVLGACALAGQAEQPAPEVRNRAPRPVLQVPRALVTPRLTADPRDPAWFLAAEIDHLTVMLGPDGEGKTPLPTRVQALWDAKYLYVRFICQDSEIYAPHKAHDDPLYSADVAEIFIDARGDGREYAELEFSPENVTMDNHFLVTADKITYEPDLRFTGDVWNNELWRDLAWTLDGLRSATSRLQDADGKITGWLVDIAVPARSLLKRYGWNQFRPMTMRGNFIRYEYPQPADPAAKRELTAMNWAPTRYGCPHVSPAAMGYIKLLD